MKKNKSSVLSTDFDLSGFSVPAAELPTPTAIGTAVQQLVVSQVEIEKPKTVERNKRKRETIKGTVLQAVMLEKDLLKQLKMTALESETSISEIVNNALKQYFQ